MKKDVPVEGAKVDTLIFEEISSYLEKRGILYINPLKEFKANAAPQKVLYFNFQGHWTIEGNRLAAKIMYDYLIGKHLIPTE